MRYNRIIKIRRAGRKRKRKEYTIYKNITNRIILIKQIVKIIGIEYMIKTTNVKYKILQIIDANITNNCYK